MTTAVASEPLIRDVRVTESEIVAYLADGRVISVPLAWSWRLSDATPAQRANWRLIGDGHGVHWPDVDEDLSATACSTACQPVGPELPRRVAARRLTDRCSRRAALGVRSNRNHDHARLAAERQHLNSR